jgi:serine/threonine-protein kinase RsbW
VAYHKQFPRNIAVLDQVFEFVNRYLSVQGISGEAAYSVDLAVEEIFTNLVKYNRSNNDIDIELECKNTVLTVKLRDHDVDRFDITEVAAVDTTLPLSERKPGGLGLHLTREAMDEIEYSYKNRISTITMRKYLEK